MRYRSLLLVFLASTPLWPQENTLRLTVLAYQWTTSHKTLTFSWPGYANTSCNGNAYVSGYSYGGNVSASGTTSSSCSTAYTPPSNQNIDIRKPVVYILAETDTSRMVLTCTRNVRWSQCHALNPGQFAARMNNGHFEVQGLFDKGKEEWIKFDIVQQAITRQQSVAQTTQPAPPSIEAPDSSASDLSSEWPKRWKSMQTGAVFMLRVDGEYIYAEQIMSEEATKAGVFFLLELKKEGDKYVGKGTGRALKTPTGPACPLSYSAEFTRVTKQRIEGRGFGATSDAKFDWATCQFSPPPAWQELSWIPVR